MSSYAACHPAVAGQTVRCSRHGGDRQLQSPTPASPAAGCPEAAEQPCGGGVDLDVWRTSQDRPTLAFPDNGRNLKGYASGSRSRAPLHWSAADLGPICHVSADGSKDEGRGTY